MEHWIELLFSYGPYAVFVLLVFLIAPKQTKIFLSCDKQDKVCRTLCGGVAVGCWILVAVMASAILYSWPPKLVYEGSLGRHSDDVIFFPGENLFLTTSDLRDGLLEWRYVVVVNNLNPGHKQSEFFLRHRWGEGDQQFKDYEIALSDFASGTFNLKSDPQDPSVLLHDNEVFARVSHHSQAQQNASSSSVEYWFAAYAQEPENFPMLINSLNSRNPHFQTQATRELHSLSNTELKSLMSTAGGSAQSQIKLELQRRIER
ncbi:MAG: hypothetical protein ISR73_00475 [Gammaproteobacteria bacterium]|nr:hypothetical protein [Gammaproteobacteria bacterium]